jgi:hypothetical protein
MAEEKVPNPASEKEKAEGDRSTVTDRAVGHEGGGITNRPLDEEQANQDAVPDRGDRKGDTHA